MAQHFDDAAAGVEPEAIDNAPVDYSEAESETPESNIYDDLYPDDGKPEPEPQADDDIDGDEDEGDDDEGDEADEEQTVPPIEAPVSLKAEFKAKFTQLPTEAQQWVAEEFKRRDTEVQSGLETARSAQRQAEAQAADNIAQAQRDFANRYEAVIQAFAPQQPPADLARTNPAEYQYAKAIYDEEIGHFSQLVGQINGMRGQADQHFSNRTQESIQQEVNKLMSMPEIANEETRAETIQGIKEAATLLGYDEAALAQIDARDAFALKKVRDVIKENETLKSDAEKWRNHQKRRNERPRAAAGRFAPAGQRVQGRASVDTLDALYPDD